MNVWLLLAGLAALAVMAVHVIVGGRLFAAPLLATEALHRVVRLTLYYCWHLVTLMIAALAAGFTVAALMPGQRALALAATALAAASAMLSIAIVAIHRVRPWHMPQWAYFTAITGLGAAGLMQ